MAQPNKTVKLLFNALRMWGWPYLFSRLDANILLVCDNDVLAELNAIGGGLKCQTKSPDKLSEPLTEATQIVVVFVQDNELALTRTLRNRYPGKTILSAAHDLAANAASAKPALPNFSNSANKDETEHSSKPTLVLATPGADSPYLVGLLKENKITHPVEYMGGALVGLTRWHNRFNLAAFTSSLRKLYAATPGFSMLLRTDVCAAMMNNAGLTEESFLRYLHVAGFNVICLSREDRITQCAQAQLFHGRKIRSVWDLPQGQREKFAETIGLSVTGSLEKLRSIMQGEHLIDLVSKSDIPSVAFTLEQLIADPAEHLKNIESLLGMPIIDNPEITPYNAPANEVPAVGRLAASLKRELIDRTGLHVF